MTHYRITWPNGKQEWFVGIQRHRENGPAVTWDGWFDEWWLNDVELTHGEYVKKLNTQKNS